MLRLDGLDLGTCSRRHRRLRIRGDPGGRRGGRLRRGSHRHRVDPVPKGRRRPGTRRGWLGSCGRCRRSVTQTCRCRSLDRGGLGDRDSLFLGEAPRGDGGGTQGRFRSLPTNRDYAREKKKDQNRGGGARRRRDPARGGEPRGPSRCPPRCPFPWESARGGSALRNPAGGRLIRRSLGHFGSRRGRGIRGGRTGLGPRGGRGWPGPRPAGRNRPRCRDGLEQVINSRPGHGLAVGALLVPPRQDPRSRFALARRHRGTPRYVHDQSLSAGGTHQRDPARLELGALDAELTGAVNADQDHTRGSLSGVKRPVWAPLGPPDTRLSGLVFGGLGAGLEIRRAGAARRHRSRIRGSRRLRTAGQIGWPLEASGQSVRRGAARVGSRARGIRPRTAAPWWARERAHGDRARCSRPCRRRRAGGSRSPRSRRSGSG